MSWVVGNQKRMKIEDFNSILKELSHDFEDQEARILLAQFLRHNIGFTFELLSGIKLLPLQEVALRGLILKDNGLFVAGRGVGKSFIISVFCALYPIFFPNSKLCLISVNFRGARRLFDASEKMVRGKNADLLNACFPNDPFRRPDILSWRMENGSEIFALPLSNGEGLRGTRASTVLVDEGLLISEEIQTSIIQPFLTARQDYAEEAQIREIEDCLIRRGDMVEADRMVFQSNKYLVFSSASYQFQYLYKMFCNYKERIIRANPLSSERVPSYFVMRASYESLPEESFMDRQAIQAAKDNGTEHSEYFKREYKALFSAAGDGFFDVKKLYECTIPDGDDPTIQIKGHKDAKYILAIDPSYAKAANSDYFAMAVYQLIPEKREIMLVHSYGRAGTSLDHHYLYLAYLLKSFNIVYSVIDASGTEFIDSFNSSVIANDHNLKLGMFSPDINFNKDNYAEMLQKAKQEYNISTRNFVYPQLFSSDTNRRMNEYLQAGIIAKKIWFASRVCAGDVSAYQDMPVPVRIKDPATENDMTIMEFLGEQDNWIVETINQLALIQVKATVTGTLQYDLPAKVKANDGPDKARRDNYTCCLLAYYASKHYFDMLFTEAEEVPTTFEPFFV
jgi:protein associated with RNAse G/E